MYAPLEGRIGEARVKVGNLVGPDSAGGGAFTDLATIQQLDPIGVDVRLSSRDLDRTTTLIEEGLAVRLTRPGPAGPQEHPYEGQGFFIDNTVDETTSTFLVKAQVPQPRRQAPARASTSRSGWSSTGSRTPWWSPPLRWSSPTRGRSSTSSTRKGKVAVRRVVAGQTHEGLRVITEGLDSGASVIVDGLQMIRPGLSVKTEPAVLTRREADGTKVTTADAVSLAEVVTPWSRDPDPSDPSPILLWEPDGHGRLLHPPADLRHGLGTPDAPDRRDLRVPLPIAQYPQIAPPQVQVTTTYTGADALSVARTVTTPIEQQINGTKGMIYLQLRQHQQRRVEHRGHVRRRLLAGHGRRRHPEPGPDGAGPAPARGQAVWRVDQEDVDRHGLRRQPDLARRPVRRQLPGQLRRRSTSPTS